MSSDLEFLEEIADANDPYGNYRDDRGRGAKRGRSAGLIAMHTNAQSLRSKIRRVQAMTCTVHRKKISKETV